MRTTHPDAHYRRLEAAAQDEKAAFNRGLVDAGVRLFAEELRHVPPARVVITGHHKARLSVVEGDVSKGPPIEIPDIQQGRRVAGGRSVAQVHVFDHGTAMIQALGAELQDGHSVGSRHERTAGIGSVLVVRWTGKPGEPNGTCLDDDRCRDFVSARRAEHRATFVRIQRVESSLDGSAVIHTVIRHGPERPNVDDRLRSQSAPNKTRETKQLMASFMRPRRAAAGAATPRSQGPGARGGRNAKSGLW